MYRYRLYDSDGDEVGQREYAVPIKPGEPVWTTDGRYLLVDDVLPVEDSDSPYDGLLLLRTTA